MSTIEIQQFIQSQLVQEAGARVSTKEVSERFAQFHSKGRNNMYKALRELTGAEAGSKFFLGYRLASEIDDEEGVEEIVEEVAVPIVVPTFVLPAKSREDILLEIELRRIAVEERNAETAARADAAAKEREEIAAAAAKEREEIAAATAEKLKNMDIEGNIRLATVKETFKRERQEACFAFAEKENNKNRPLVNKLNETFHRWLDFETFGTAGIQYVPIDSAARVCTTVVRECSPPQLTLKAMRPLVANLTQRLKDAAEDVPMHVEYQSKIVKAINIDDVSTHVVELVDQLNEIVVNEIDVTIEKQQLQTMKTRMTKILSEYNIEPLKNAITDDDPTKRVPSTRTEIALNHELNIIDDESTPKRMMGRESYTDELVNAPFYKSGHGLMCYCSYCKTELVVNSKGTHRSHIVAKSNGGSFGEHNIVIDCATCNQNIGELHRFVAMANDTERDFDVLIKESLEEC